MADPFITRDDPSIPVLTEVIDLPDTPAATPEPAPVPLIQQAVELAHDEPVDEAFYAEMRESLLHDLQQRIEPIMRERMRLHIALVLDKAIDEIAAKLNDEVGVMLEEGLHKELIRKTALLEQRRQRPRPDDIPG